MNDSEKSGFEKWLQDSYLSPQLKSAISESAQVVGTASEIAGGITTIVGIIGAVVKLIDFLQFAQQGADPMQQLAAQVQAIENLLISSFEWNAAAQWDEVVGPMTTAANALGDVLTQSLAPAASPPGLLTDTDRAQAYDNLIQPTRNVLNILLPPGDAGIPAFQYAVNLADSPVADLHYLPSYFVKADAATLGVIGLPEVGPLDGPSLPQMALIWDYRRALPHILHAVVQLIACFKVYDPAFRTTGRFRQNIREIVANLDTLAARWFECIYWTRALPIDPTYPNSDFPEANYPRALDTRARVVVDHITEHPEVDYFVAVPDEPEYSKRRLEYGQKVLVYSGFNDFRAWVDQVRDLASLPPTSESIDPQSRISAARSFVRTTKVAQAGAMRTVKIFRVSWTVAIDMTVQPQLPPYDYAHDLPIRYEFFLESYQRGPIGSPAGVPSGADQPQDLVDRLHLSPGSNQRVHMNVMSPDVYVPSADDGSYGPPHSDPRAAELLPVAAGRGQSTPAPISGFLHDAATLTQPSVGWANRPYYPGGAIVRPAELAAARRNMDVNLSNETLAALASVSAKLGELVVSEGPLPKAVFLNGELTETTFACTLEFGPRGDVREGFVSFRAWNIDGEDKNVGALYFVIEETPPLDSAARIRTLLPVPINPIEMWYAAYSSTAPHYVPE